MTVEHLLAPVSGLLMPITDVSDPVFFPENDG